MRTEHETQVAALQAQLEVEREHTRRLQAQLRNLADNDPVTDLANRRTVVQEIELHLAGCGRYGAEGALLLVGLDGLDSVHGLDCIAGDDGQDEADEVLADLAEVVVARLRSTDVAGRFGPDELAILLPRANVDEVVVVADELVKLVARAGSGRVPPGSLVASIGIAAVTDRLQDACQLVERASDAMASARSRGGGGWVAAGWRPRRSEGAAGGVLPPRELLLWT